jgi:peptidoglycan/LPS O-acetylase OafA/YrhL
MAIVVIAIHTNPFVGCNIRFVNEFAMIIEDMAVPFFFITSGFLLTVKWGETAEEKKIRVDKMLASTIKMYVIWTLISFPLSVYGYIESGNSLVSCVLSYVKYFFFVGKLYNSYHLWYLLALIYALALIRAMLGVNGKVSHMLGVGIVLYIVYLVFLYLEQGTISNLAVGKVVQVYEFIFNKGGVLSGMLYVTIGMIIAESGKRVDMRLCALLMVLGIFVKYYILSDLGVIISSTMLFLMVLGIKLPPGSIYKSLRGLSKYIYLTHLICFSIYTFIIGDLNKLGADSFVATLILSLICSYGIFKRIDMK